MVNNKLKLTTFSRKRSRPRRTVPDQSLSLTDILTRFTKGLPVVGKNNTPVFINSETETDFEKLGRADFAEKHEIARQSKLKAEAIKEAFTTAEREKRAKAKEQADKKAEAEKQTGIDTLDNTMPDDTSLETKRLGGNKKNK